VSGSASGIATKVCPASQAQAADIVIRYRGLSHRGLSYLLVPLAWVGVGTTGAPTTPARCDRGCHRGCAVGSRGDRGCDPRQPGVATALQLAAPHLCVRILCDIVMVEHGVTLSHRGLPFAPCAHTLSLLYVASHPPPLTGQSWSV
jgi:hypothetical protein